MIGKESNQKRGQILRDPHKITHQCYSKRSPKLEPRPVDIEHYLFSEERRKRRKGDRFILTPINFTMPLSKTTKILLVLITIHAGLLTLAVLLPEQLGKTPFGLALALPYMSIYIFHELGIPGLLHNGGACGWSWCGPTLWGWIFLILFWVFILWLVARAIAWFHERRTL